MVLRSSIVVTVREIAVGGHMLLSVFMQASLLREIMNSRTVLDTLRMASLFASVASVAYA